VPVRRSADLAAIAAGSCLVWIASASGYRKLSSLHRAFGGKSG
jgi:hypothetical protein